MAHLFVQEHGQEHRLRCGLRRGVQTQPAHGSHMGVQAVGQRGPDRRGHGCPRYRLERRHLSRQGLVPGAAVEPEQGEVGPVLRLRLCLLRQRLLVHPRQPVQVLQAAQRHRATEPDQVQGQAHVAMLLPVRTWAGDGVLRPRPRVCGACRQGGCRSVGLRFMTDRRHLAQGSPIGEHRLP
jgi:hypothetical protein